MRSLLLLCVIILLTGFTKKTTPTENVCVSSEETKLYNMIMEYRKSRKLKPIPLSAKLTQVAQAHAHDLADNYTFNPSGKCNPHSWSKKGTWTSCCYTNDHKQAKCMWDKPREIAGYEDNGYEIAYYSSLGAQAKEAIEGWKKSPSHNPLLINDGMWSKVDWNAIGIGLYKEYGVVWFGQINDTSSSPTLCKQ
jgi:uncharacterized protein YkwD